MRILTTLTVAGVLVAGSAQAQSIMADHAWARATTPSQTSGGIFISLMDMGPDDALVGARSPIADTLQVHETVEEAGVMKMRPVPSLPLPSMATVELKPGGYHVMVMGLKQQLKPGDTFPVTLSFAHAAPMTVSVTVEAAGASAMPGMPGMKMP